MGRVVAVYVAGLFAVVAWTASDPLSNLVIWALWGWLAPFFVFSTLVCTYTYGFLALAVVRRASQGLTAVRSSRRCKPSKATPDPPVLWDRWLDGIGGP